MTLKEHLARFLPPPEFLFNHLGNRLPPQFLRIAVARLLGVRFTNPRRAAIMWGAELWSPGNLEIGVGSVIGRFALIDARGGIRIGDSVNVSGYSRLMTAKHEVDDPEFGATFDEIVIGDRAWIGIGATILGGVTIGEGAVVSANATVTRDVEPYAIVAGTPARKVRERSHDLTYELTYRPNWL